MNSFFKSIGRTIRAPKGFLLGVVLCILPLTGCVSYQDQAREIHAHYQAGDFDTAQAALTGGWKRLLPCGSTTVWKTARTLLRSPIR